MSQLNRPKKTEITEKDGQIRFFNILLLFKNGLDRHIKSKCKSSICQWEHLYKNFDFKNGRII